MKKNYDHPIKLPLLPLISTNYPLNSPTYYQIWIAKIVDTLYTPWGHLYTLFGQFIMKILRLCLKIALITLTIIKYGLQKLLSYFIHTAGSFIFTIWATYYENTTLIP